MSEESAEEPIFLELEEIPEVDETETTRTSPASGGSAVPGWFSRKRARSAEEESTGKRKPSSKARSSRSRGESLPAIVPAAEDQPDLFWREPTLLEKLSQLVGLRPRVEEGEVTENPHYRRFRQLLAFALAGYGVSLILHTLMTVALALFIFEKARTGDYSLLFADADDDVVELDETIDTSLDLAGGAEEQLELPHMQVVNIDQSEIVVPAISEELRPQLPASGDGAGGTKGDGAGPGFAMPKGGNVVSKGSFTAWTIPEDPQPGQNYLIVIQIELPDKVTRYRRSDLSGIVVGTDGYRQAIPGITRGFLPVKEKRSQLVIQVPGAARLVRDTINVRSKLLKESQRLEIVF